VSHEGQYSTDIVSSKAHGFLDDAVAAKKPFMLTVAPIAPHSNVHAIDKNVHGNYTGASAIQAPPVPADRHKHLFQDVKVPRNAAFNPDSVVYPSVAHTLRTLLTSHSLAAQHGYPN
jgi:N-acetylglucosamine-6-sulfatase